MLSLFQGRGSSLHLYMHVQTTQAPMHVYSYLNSVVPLLYHPIIITNPKGKLQGLAGSKVCFHAPYDPREGC